MIPCLEEMGVPQREDVVPVRRSGLVHSCEDCSDSSWEERCGSSQKGLQEPAMHDDEALSSDSMAGGGHHLLRHPAERKTSPDGISSVNRRQSVAPQLRETQDLGSGHERNGGKTTQRVEPMSPQVVASGGQPSAPTSGGERKPRGWNSATCDRQSVHGTWESAQGDLKSNTSCCTLERGRGERWAMMPDSGASEKWAPQYQRSGCLQVRGGVSDIPRREESPCRIVAIKR